MIDPNGIQFEAESHQYSLYSQTAHKWQPVPSVTQILVDMGFVDSTFFTDYGRERGKLVHRIIHWHITDDLDPDTVDASLQGYLDAWGAFTADTGFVSTATENPMASEIHRFAGTPDYIGMLNGHNAIVDAKTGTIAPWVGIQLAGYEILRNEGLKDAGMLRCKRFALALKEDGKYSLKEFKDRQDRGIFLSALACYWWKNNNLKGRG